MPDVIINNMEMPESCYDCLFAKTNDDLLSDDYRYMYCDFPQIGAFVTDYIVTRHPDCPLCPAPEWISVEDDPPPANTAIQLLVNLRYQVVAMRRKGEWVMSWDFKPLDLDSEDVLHWRPLPRPPKEETT